MSSLAWYKGLKKTPSWSSVEAYNKIDVFYTGIKSHQGVGQDRIRQFARAIELAN